MSRAVPEGAAPRTPFLPLRLVLSLLLAALLLPACVAAAPPAPATPTATAAPTAAPTPHPLLALLDERDRAHAAGDIARTLALVDPGAPAPFRAREGALAQAIGKRRPDASRRQLVREAIASDLATIVVSERDDQGRERLVRYFLTQPSPLLTEPTAGQLGEGRTLDFPGGAIRYRPIDADQAEVLAAEAQRAVASLVARLGPEYAPRAPLSLALRPEVVPDLPPLASAVVAQGQVTFLSSASMLVASGPGSVWTRTVIAHEIAHVLLSQRGSGTFLLNEGIPLWLTDDHRQPELDRLVAANALWTLEHLVDGPRDPSEFFAGYAQASAFVRFTAERHGERAVIAMWEAGRRLPFVDAYREATGIDAAAAHTTWRASLGR